MTYSDVEVVRFVVHIDGKQNHCHVRLVKVTPLTDHDESTVRDLEESCPKCGEAETFDDKGTEVGGATIGNIGRETIISILPVRR
jgi:hypothetical protein